MSKYTVLTVLGLLWGNFVEAPINPPCQYITLKVRITAYSSKQPKEGNKTATGKSARNEIGVAVPKGFLPMGTKIILPNGESRVVDDRTSRWAGKKFNGKLVDVRYYTTIKSKPKTRSVNKELRKLDMGWDKIRILK